MKCINTSMLVKENKIIVMYCTIRIIFLSLLFLKLEGLIFLKFVSASEHSLFDKSKSFNAPKKPLTFLTPFDEVFVLKHTGRSLDLDLITPKTVGALTGGLLGENIYRFHKCRWYWQDGLSSGNCNNGSVLESRLYYFNIKYGSFKNALHYPNGVIDVFIPIETNGHIYNPLYWEFEKQMGEKIKKPDDQALINGGVTYLWYEHFTYKDVYSLYSGSSHFDEESGKTYFNTITIELPLNRLVNFVSHEQFKHTFGSLVNCSGKPLSNPVPDIQHSSRVKKEKGICVINLPA
ncbi:uncharacterized protein LOC135846932 isoform X1 [Planococcus citri]|uniref:uncharacterized protein LOC135846932 isoform X1 n=1 Tax=Planococcus citri TaxID=170843 RepID=UPI0031F8D985